MMNLSPEFLWDWALEGKASVFAKETLESTTGMLVGGFDEMGEPFEALIAWDGAQPSPLSDLPIGFYDEEETQPIFRESSKGLLLGGYATKGDGWDDWRAE